MRFKKVKTADGSLTCFHPEYAQNYHSLVGAKTEAIKKFIQPSGLLFLKKVQLLDIGFGLGYNALEAWMAHDSIRIVSLEKDRTILPELLDIHKGEKQQELLSSLIQTSSFSMGEKSFQIFWGDARTSVRTLAKAGNVFDIVFLDAFSPPTNPELWTVEFLQDIFSLLKASGRVVTYSSALSVISAFRRVGFTVFFTPSVGRTRGGLVAFRPPLCNEQRDMFSHLSLKEEFFLAHSVRGLPNLDRNFSQKIDFQNYRKRLSEVAVRIGFRLPHKAAEKQWNKQ